MARQIERPGWKPDAQQRAWCAERNASQGCGTLTMTNIGVDVLNRELKAAVEQLQPRPVVIADVHKALVAVPKYCKYTAVGDGRHYVPLTPLELDVLTRAIETCSDT